MPVKLLDPRLGADSPGDTDRQHAAGECIRGWVVVGARPRLRAVAAFSRSLRTDRCPGAGMSAGGNRRLARQGKRDVRLSLGFDDHDSCATSRT